MTFVDADHAGVEFLSDAPGAGEVLAEQIGCKPERRIVGKLDGVGLGSEAHQRRDGAEDLSSRTISMSGVTSPTTDGR